MADKYYLVFDRNLLAILETDKIPSDMIREVTDRPIIWDKSYPENIRNSAMMMECRKANAHCCMLYRLDVATMRLHAIDEFLDEVRILGGLIR